MIVDSSSQSYQSFCPCFRLLLLDHVLTPRMKARSQDAESITSSPVAIPRPREGLGGHCQGWYVPIAIPSPGNAMQGPKWIHVIHIAGSHQPKKSLQLGTSAMVEPAFSHQPVQVQRLSTLQDLGHLTEQGPTITLGWGSRCRPCHQRCHGQRVNYPGHQSTN